MALSSVPEQTPRQSVFSRKHLDEWILKELPHFADEDQIHKVAQHRHRIWKHLTSPNASQNAASASDIPDLNVILKKRFDDHFTLTTSRVVKVDQNEHGGKLLVELSGKNKGKQVETVIIKHSDKRSTVCVSSQVGCQMGCTFCATGLMGKQANLTAAEIVEQVYHALVIDPNCSNLVFMGMGEPLDNASNVLEAIETLSNPHIFRSTPIPMRRITVSTVGVVPGIRKLTKAGSKIQLALSLHAPNDAIREKIVPTSKTFTISKIFAALDEYQASQQSTKATTMMEYIMIDGVNASAECAHELGRLLQNRKCIVNLIPYNPTEAGDRFNYEAPSRETTQEFSKIMLGYSIRCSVRWSSERGQELNAACGQLVLKNNGCSDDTSGGDMEDMGGKKKQPSSSRARRKTKQSTKTSKAKEAKADKSSKRWIYDEYSTLILSSVALFSIGAGLFALRRK